MPPKALKGKKKPALRVRAPKVQISDWDATELRRIVKLALNEQDPVAYLRFLMVTNPNAFCALAARVLPPVVGGGGDREPPANNTVVFVMEEGRPAPKVINVTQARPELSAVVEDVPASNGRRRKSGGRG